MRSNSVAAIANAWKSVSEAAAMRFPWLSRSNPVGTDPVFGEPWRERWCALRETVSDRALTWSTGGMAMGALGGILGAKAFPPHWVGGSADEGIALLAGAFGVSWLCEGAAYFSGIPAAWDLLRERFNLRKTSTTTE